MDDGTSKLVPFDITDNLGTLMPIKSWISETSPMARQLGSGPSLFLMSTKAFAIFFVFLTILNIPVFRFYYYGKEHEQGASIFTDFSLGNIGSSHVACGTSKYSGLIYGYNQGEADWYNTNKTINLQCRDGSVLTGIHIFGLSRNENSSCANIDQNPSDMVH